MGVDQRTINLGRKAELIEELDRLARTIHNEIRALKDACEPQTVDYSYIKNINTDDLRVFSAEIVKHKKKYDALLAQLTQVKKDLGEREDD